jgi:hypothetical protein
VSPRRFQDFVAIDWSGEAVARPRGLALAHAAAACGPPALVRPDRGWSRQALLDWLLDHAAAGSDLLIGLDLSPGLPFADAGAYFPGWADSPRGAKALWSMVDSFSAGDPHLSVSGFLAHAEVARYFRRQKAPIGDRFGAAGRGRLRACEEAQLTQKLSPSSCFNLVGAAQVGKSSLTGMRVLHRLGGRIPVWPFDPVPPTGPVIVEIYTTIAARAAGVGNGRSKVRDAAALRAGLERLGAPGDVRLDRYDDHSTDALLTAAWLRRAAEDHALWRPTGMTEQIARTEGWTFGVP